MAPVRIKHVVSFTSEDPKHRVVNLCSGGGVSSPWLCSAAERSGLLKAELQLERASTIAFIDVGNHGSAFIQVDVGRSSWSIDHAYVPLLPTATLMSPADSRQGTGKHTVRMFKKGDFLPQAAEESWDRLRVTCSQPFNKRNQFGLSFFRVRTADEHTEEPSANQENPTTKNQSTPDKMWSVREWISSPPVQHTFFGQKTGESSPGEPTKDPGKLSRAERMVTAAQSIRRSLHKTSCNALISSSERQEKTQNTKHGPARTPQACRRKSETIQEQASMSSTPKRSRCGTSDVTATKKKNNAFRHSPIKSHIPATSLPKNSPDYPEPPETVCPICGVSFSPDYLPLHASSCLDSGSVEFSSVMEREPGSYFSFHPPSDPSTDEFMVPCPLCSIRFPIDCIQQHASSCGDTVWLD
ncbi:hypothetical protein PGIGA_G00063330 [Pangasianodon gigas]|uniref:Uncharacterized protein n=1 Tax=Pangasianodon gigas TaxID=30993 RepID=A0ACC5X644_PANGG|nr:hypothetical protein [Pangasianodon gigas]